MRDDQERGSTGIVASLVVRPRGRVRVVFDDVERSGSSWRTLRLYTLKEMSSRAFRELKVNEKQLAEVGFALLVRLAAVEKLSSSLRKKASNRQRPRQAQRRRKA